MVKLTVVDGRVGYFNYQGFLIGPCPVEGIHSEENFVWRHPNDTIWNHPAIYGQNSCNHWKIEAALTADRSPKLIPVPAPTSQSPHRIGMLSKLNGVSNYPMVYFVRGQFLGGDRFVPENLTTTHNYYVMQSGVEPGSIVFTHLMVAGSHQIPANRVHGWTRYEFTMPTLVMNSRYTISISQTSRRASYAPAGFPTTFDAVSKEHVVSYLETYGGTTTSATTSSSGYWYYPTGLVPIPMDTDRLVDEINARLVVHPSVYEYPGELSNYGDLANSAVGGLDAVQMNMISFLSELPEISSLIPKLQNLKKLRSIRNAVKDASDAFLTSKYGWMPTISDLQEIWHAMTKYVAITDRNGFQVASARSTAGERISETESYTATQCIKLAVADEDNLFLQLLEGLENVGTFPSFNNLWDLVPYSFVLDWFIDVGDLLERVDTRLRLLRLDIRYVTMSLKVVRWKHFVQDDKLPFVGDVNWVQYRRWTSSQCPVPPLSLQTNLLPTNHWLEGSALILQRMR